MVGLTGLESSLFGVSELQDYPGIGLHLVGAALFG